MRRFRTILIAAIAALSLPASLPAAPPFVAQDHIPSPEDVLGYRLGDRYTSHAGIVKYLSALAEAAPDRIRIVRYGTTYEGRALEFAVLSSPSNLARLDQIRSDSRRLADPRMLSEREAAELARATPAIAWLSYGVHGNEASSPEAALNVLHTLLTSPDPEAAGLLDSLVVVIDPLLNPDGHERYVNYQVTSAGMTPKEDPEAVEHNEAWPSGRTNHYFFDLNRDWAWLTQEESRARIAAYREWMPHVHVDFHEMGYNSSYFFFPAFKPINKNFPASTIEWGEIYGRGNAEAFDRQGWSYYSGESFDLFYPGYGDSWPSLHGAIGMTYEQAGQSGVKIKRRDEEILTLRERLEHHSATSIATLKTTADNREKRLKDFHRFFADAIAEGRNGPVKSFLVPPGRDAARSARMIDLLIKQGVEVLQSSQEFAAGDARTYFPATRRPNSFPAGTWIVRLDQPAKRLVMALMEREPVVTDTSFYDISAWCLPIAYGVETWWSSGVPAVPASPVAQAAVPPGSVSGGKARYAYIMPWTSNSSAMALARLLQAGYKAHTAMREFTHEGRRYGRGTIIVPVRPNPRGIDSAMKSIAETFHLSIAA
ncbi:MAG TPA: M14 metallopeptidase family protein, partial [Bacteroidota bacterium]|nr:M14 metallopeptidase family protein [Bacteroidota bacterium]